MKLLIDLFACQTNSRFRGIGRYTHSLVREMVNLRGRKELVMLASSLYPETFEELRDEFSRLLPQGAFLPYSHQPNNVNELDRDPFIEISSTIVRHAYQLVAPDAILYPSIFESYNEWGVVPLPHNGFPTPLCAAIIYDFIPYRFSNHFLDPDPIYKESYLRKLNSHKNFDLLLAISESTRQDAIEILGLQPDKVVNISAAADPIFMKKEYGQDQINSLFNRINLKKPFILYTGNVEYHKNMEELLRAFSKLPVGIRTKYQIVLTHAGDETLFKTKIHALGLADDEVVITGHISDRELVMLYNLCKLFVFPSLYEGFGLPILEAMACGAPVIASNNSSIPEVMGREDAMFDAQSETSITEALNHALTNDEFRQDLAAYGLERIKLFSWEMCAQKAWKAIDDAVKDKNKHHEDQFSTINKKPRIAYVSPLPPQKSGIADYSADLLPYLKKYFNIDIFIDPGLQVNDSRLRSDFHFYPWPKLLQMKDDYATVVYQLGNSAYHAHMLKLLKEFPGIVVLHDFFLSHLIHHLCATNHSDFINKDFKLELSNDHSLRSLVDLSQKGTDLAKWDWPLCWQVLKHAQEIIVHSTYQFELLERFYGNGWTPKLNLIRQPRQPIDHISKNNGKGAKEKLGIDQDEFIFCSFGFINSMKLSLLIIQAYKNAFADKDKTILVFVGELEEGKFGDELLNAIGELNLKDHIKITGYVDDETYKQYLLAADVAIQMRTSSRGETSRAVLDALAYGKPTIINSHGSLSDYSSDIVVKLPEYPDTANLANAMVSLYNDRSLCENMGIQARKEISQTHDPELISMEYAAIISRVAQANERLLFAPLIESLFRNNIPNEGIKISADYAAANFNLRCQPRILIDVSNISYVDLHTGIQRVVKSIIQELFTIAGPSIHIELVKINDGKLLRSLRFSENLFNLRRDDLGQETPILIQPGDYLFMLDTSWNLFDQFSPIFELIHKNGGRIFTMIYDLIPIRFPHTTVNSLPKVFYNWINAAIQQSDTLVCISRSTAEDVVSFIEENKIEIKHSLDLVYVQLGADISALNQENKYHIDVVQMITNNGEPLFLMVGTIEPRKGHNFVIDAFEQLWQEGLNYRLCIIGKIGWNVEQTEARIRSHLELGKRLFFFENASDAEINFCYEHATALVSASIAEGFGLPIVEAAFHKIPAVVSDIPVFHEVGGDGSLFFSLESPARLANAVQKMAKLAPEERLVMAQKIKILTWRECARMTLEVLQNKRIYKTITPNYNH